MVSLTDVESEWIEGQRNVAREVPGAPAETPRILHGSSLLPTSALVRKTVTV
jgi:hypothetical protein